MTLDEAAAAPGRKVAVIGDEVRDGQRQVSIHRVDRDGCKPLAWGWVAVDQIDARVGGLEIALTEEFCDLFWIVSASGVEVYDIERRVLEARGEQIRLEEEVIARDDLAVLFAFATDDYVHRGIKATLRSGKEVTLVSEISTAAYAGAEGWPVYSRNEYLCDTVWCVTLGRAIASWAGVELENRLP